jgi:hypothetical protein
MVALAVPVVLSELGWMAMGIVDTIMVGRLGPAAIGAVALGNAVYYTPAICGIGLLLGLDTLVSQALRPQRSRRMPPLAGAGRLSGLHRYAAADAADRAGQLWLCPLRHQRARWPLRPPLTCASSTGAPCRCCSMPARAATCKAWAMCASLPSPMSPPTCSTGSATGC